MGRNLQDRYEIGVVSRMAFEHWKVLEGARFTRGDPQYREWATRRRGVYASNGAILGVSARSAPARILPDLYCFGLLAKFEGYFPGYSKPIAERLDYLTWAILKGHTGNRAGEVTLRSPDPREPPHVNFRYFEEGSDPAGEDLDSVVAGIKLVRRINAGLRRDGLIAEEERPGEHVRSDAELRDFVRAHAWGHHASCTCAIGPRERGGVLDRRLPRARHPRPARGRRLGLPPDPGLLSRQRGLHGRREGGRRHPHRGGSLMTRHRFPSPRGGY